MKLKQQRGGFVLGMIVGLLVGLALALGVALYVTKVPIPFVNKVPQRSAEQDAAEAERNKNWDPNAPLGGRAPKPAAAPAVPSTPPAAPPAAATPAPPPATAKPAPAPGRDPAAILAGKPLPGDVSAAAGADPFTYFVQAGAYARSDEAEAQRAKLAMLGFAAKITEREQSGRTMYRVRLGPFEQKDDADRAKERLAGSGIEAALVRVQK